MSSWLRTDEHPLPTGVPVLCMGKERVPYIGKMYVMLGGLRALDIPDGRGPSKVMPTWWCPIPYFDGEDGRDER